jgi:hypothetical protein
MSRKNVTKGMITKFRVYDEMGGVGELFDAREIRLFVPCWVGLAGSGLWSVRAREWDLEFCGDVRGGMHFF